MHPIGTPLLPLHSTAIFSRRPVSTRCWVASVLAVIFGSLSIVCTVLSSANRRICCALTTDRAGHALTGRHSLSLPPSLSTFTTIKSTKLFVFSLPSRRLAAFTHQSSLALLLLSRSHRVHFPVKFFHHAAAAGVGSKHTLALQNNAHAHTKTRSKSLTQQVTQAASHSRNIPHLFGPVLCTNVPMS
jgi:hypothetical protein